MKRSHPSMRSVVRACSGRWLLWIVFACFLLNPSTLAADSDEMQKSVLVLYATRREAPELIAAERIYHKTLSEGLAGRLDYYSEYIDVARFPEPAYQATLRDYLRHKYERQRFDVIIITSNTPLKFVEQYGAELFPGTPVVFIGGGALPSLPNATGVSTKIDLQGTLDLALSLQPATRRVFVVSGASDFDKYYLDIARRQFQGFEERVEFTYLIGLPMADLQQTVADLPTDSIIYYLSVVEDGAGNRLLPMDSLDKISAVANAPIYCWHEVGMDHGIVGGNLMSSEIPVKLTADLALRVLRGENPRNIPVTEAEINVNMFDWRQLRRWGISEQKLPPDSVIRFKQPSLWEEYKWRIISVISLVILQSLLIVGLVINRVRRKRAEESLQQTQSELAHVARVMITGELAATIAHEVNQPLTAMVANANATRRMLGNGNADLEEAREAIDDIVKDAHRASQVVGRIRSLLRKDPHRTEPLAINEVIAEVVAIARNDLVGKRVMLKLELSDGLPKVEADRVEIQQVMLNLMMNAVEAMRSVEEGARNLLMRTARNESGDVLVEVQDSGIGIAPENLARIFDAFYTTRHEGMGMGLSICRTIIEAHGGKLWAESNGDLGATFRFTLPKATDAETRALSDV